MNLEAGVRVLFLRRDYSLEPGRVLGKDLERTAAPNRAKIYGAFGRTTQDGQLPFGLRRDGIALWAPDVDAFLNVTMKQVKLCAVK